MSITTDSKMRKSNTFQFLRLLFTVGMMFGSIGVVKADNLMIGLILKTEANPFFVTMKEAAINSANRLGIKLRVFTGEYDGDHEAQITAVQTLLAAGAKGILITPSDPAALAGTIKQVRNAGVLVYALDTPFETVDIADATFATNNFRAGESIGEWTKEKLGFAAENARIVTLDGYESQVSVDRLRNQGFLTGFGIDIGDPEKMYDEDDPRIVGYGTTRGAEAGGRMAMENLLQKLSGFEVVYTINEPAAAGAFTALKAAGRHKKVLIVSIDGGCEGVRKVAAGELSATAMQFPVRMAAFGIEALVTHLKTGIKPIPSTGLNYYDTGTTLVTDTPVPGIDSISSEQALTECWG